MGLVGIGVIMVLTMFVLYLVANVLLMGGPEEEEGGDEEERRRLSAVNNTGHYANAGYKDASLNVFGLKYDGIRSIKEYKAAKKVKKPAIEHKKWKKLKEY